MECGVKGGGVMTFADELTEEITEWSREFFGDLNPVAARTGATERKLEKAMKLLYAIEWASGFCPWCLKSKELGHRLDCALNAVLRGD